MRTGTQRREFRATVRGGLLVVHRVRFWLHRRRRARIRGAAVRLQRWVRRGTEMQRWATLRRATGSLHMLVRGFCIRAYLDGMVRCVVVIQRAAKRFVETLRRHRRAFRIATLAQAWYRGVRDR